MCGIAGIVGPDAGRLVPLVKDMLGALGHRGPDGNGVVAFPGCVLGSTRLAIVDVEGGAQPMARADGRVAVTFNGEVYGHRRLRAELDGYPFRTSCDTEVLLALHQQRGARFVEALPGMFAYGLWDDTTQRLHGGRDRFGEKPFYWCRGPAGEFAFASEIKALLATGWVDRTVDDTALGHYLRHGHTPPLRSIYRQVNVLGPGRRLTVERGEVTETRYWSPPPVRRRIPWDEAVDGLASRLEEAVVDQLEADVPVGAFLSGGLDSSSVVALAAEHHRDLHTFSFGFGRDDDETAYAVDQAQRSGTTHHLVVPTELDLVDTVRRLPTVYDEPFGDTSAVPTLLLAEATRRHVKVALTGDGADELLGGYLFWSRGHLRDSGVRLPPALGGPAPSWLPWRRRRLAEAYVGFRSYLDDGQLDALGLRGLDLDPPMAQRPTGTVTDLLRFDVEGYLPGDILVKTDRASMAHGLELRSPFLDRAVAEWCLSLPDEVKVDEEAEKLVLRAAMGDRLAASVRSRAKQGFGGPMAEWLATPAMAELAGDVLGSRRGAVFDLVDPVGVEPFLDGRGQATWNLLMLAVWAEEHAGARR